MAAHAMRFRACYEDVDVGGVMYHTRYLAFAERSRSASLRHHGIGVGHLMQDLRISFFIRDLTVRYHAPVCFDEEFEVTTEIMEESPVRLVVAHQVFNLSRDCKLATEIKVVLVLLSVSTMKPARLPEEYRQKIRGLMHDTSNRA